MSKPGTPSPGAPKYTGGQIALIVCGVILLLPGLCSIFFVLSLAADFNAKSFFDPIEQMILVLWGLCFAVSAVGIWMIVAARRRARSSPR